MLTVEHAGKKKPPTPPKLAVWRHGEQRRLERGRASSRGLDPNPEPRTRREIPLDRPNERVPLRIGAEVRKDSPDPLLWRIDLDLAPELTHLPIIAGSMSLYPCGRGSTSTLCSPRRDSS